MNKDDFELGIRISMMTAELREDNPKTLPDCKFKVGDIVKYIGNNPIYSKTEREGTYIISSIAKESENNFEISLSGFPYLVWDNEIELVV